MRRESRTASVERADAQGRVCPTSESIKARRKTKSGRRVTTMFLVLLLRVVISFLQAPVHAPHFNYAHDRYCQVWVQAQPRPRIIGHRPGIAMTVEAAATPIVELSDPRTVADKLTISPSLPEKFKPEAEQQELMKAGHEANARGDVKEALALFKQCYEAGERLEARISAANMLLKLGSQPRGDKYLTEAVAEFQAMLRQVNDSALQDHVRDKLLTLLFRKYKTSIDEAKKRRLLNRAMAEQMNPGSTRKSLRNVRVSRSSTCTRRAGSATSYTCAS